MTETNNNQQKENKIRNGEVIIGRHYCVHCGSGIDRYLWSVALQLEINEEVIISARGQNINKQERIVSLLKTLGCTEKERTHVEEDGFPTLKIVVKRIQRN
jgi:hypothetical protein